MPSTVALCAAVVTVSVLANACGESPTSPSAVTGGANLAVTLTDAPIDDVELVNIYFTSVTVKPQGKPVTTLTLRLTENPINLLITGERTKTDETRRKG